MEHKISKGIFRKAATLAMVFALSFSLATASWALTVASTGTNLVQYNGVLDYEVWGYVYYNSNTATALDLYSLCQWVHNYGTYPVDYMEFYAIDGMDDKCVFYYPDLSPAIATGGNARVEIDWLLKAQEWGYSDAVFQKGNSFVFTRMGSGHKASYLLGGFVSYWSSDEVNHMAVS